MAGISPVKSESDTSGKLSPVAATRGEREYQEFLTRTKDMLFVREPVACVRAQMADGNNAPYSRVFAWCRLTAWGRYRFWCMSEDGTAAKQKDCATALGLHKGTVSKSFAALFASGMVELRDGRLCPVLSPELKATPPPDEESDPEFEAFVRDIWRPANPDLAKQLDEADEILRRADELRKRAREIRRDVNGATKHDFGVWQATGELPPQQLLPGSVALNPVNSTVDYARTDRPDAPDCSAQANSEVAAQQPDTRLLPVSAAPPAEFSRPELPVSDAPPAELQRPESPPIREDGKTLGDEQTPRRPSVALCTRVRNCLKIHAHAFPELPKEPDDAIVEKIASYITDQSVFDRFSRQVRKTALRRRRLETWAYFEPVARVALLNETPAPPEAEPPPEKIPPQSEDEMFAELRGKGWPEEELEMLRAKLASDRARSA